MRSTASCRALIVAQPPAQDHPRVLNAESRLEEKVVYLTLADQNVHDIWDQPPAISFTDQSGKSRTHTFDFLVTFKSGHRRALAVKPLSKVYQKDFLSDLRQIANDLPRDFADKAALVTDRSFTRAEALNAERLHHLQKEDDCPADDIIHDIAASLHDPISIADLSIKTGLKGRAFGAAFRAIYSGVLSQVSPGIIDRPTLVIAGEVLS